MSTGMGIFLASIVIGGVMLYGITQDRWDWKELGRKIYDFAYISGMAIGFIWLIIDVWEGYREGRYDFDFTWKGFFSNLISIFIFLWLVFIPNLLQEKFFKSLGKDPELTDDGETRFSYRASWVISAFIFLYLYNIEFYGVIHRWVLTGFK